MQTDDHYAGAALAASISEVYELGGGASGPISSVCHAHLHPDAARTHKKFSHGMIKRTMDVLSCFALFPFLLPLCGFVALLIKLTSRGPVFFSHCRIGKDGKSFAMWKFRTMHLNSAEVLEQYLAEHPELRKEWNTTHKLRHDPRVTSLGHVLRRYSLDELPQIWNVLLGDMALVGPRPIVTAEIEKYGDCFQCFCEVKPGMTGLWQVSGRSSVTYPERVAFDCKFVRDWSLWLEIKILVKTIPAVFKSDGAF